ncbi:MAG: 30S ribosomal protein S4 [Candidatus Pacearchaeota archaeon]
MSWIRKKKQYTKPRKLYDKKRIEEEKDIIQKYGLKNKREIWKADSKIRRIRGMAKNLITASQEKQNKLIEKLKKIGFKVEKIADVLALTKENWLERRLQTIVFKKGLTKTPKGARQMITHKHITVDGRVINKPSYIIDLEKENKIGIKFKTKPLQEAGEIKKNE